MSGQSLALASLTATYTDSEAEEEDEEAGMGEEDGAAAVISPESSARSTVTAVTTVTTPPQAQAVVSSKVAQLVSYHDDTLVSDEEGAGGEAALDDGVKLFTEPPGRCSNELQDKINRLHDKMLSSGLDMNHVIQQRKDFRNPSIYEKLIQFCSINELGTNYPLERYDPLRWGKESFYEELARVQKSEMERREKERKDRMRVEYVSGTAKRQGTLGTGTVGGTTTTSTTDLGLDDKLLRRKSKWDQVGTLLASANTAGAQAQAGVLKPGLVQPSATGTKGTVISAFGSLPKKPRV